MPKRAKKELNHNEEDRDSNHHRNQDKGNRVTAGRNAILAAKDYPCKQASAHEERGEKQLPPCEREASQRVPGLWFLVRTFCSSVPRTAGVECKQGGLATSTACDR